MEPVYEVETLYRATFDFHAPEADDQRKIIAFVRRLENEHEGDTVFFDYQCGGIKMVYDWFLVLDYDRKVVDRIARKVYNYLKRFKRVRINP